VKTPNPRFGKFTLRTRKERAETREETKWAARSGEVETRHVQDEPLHTKTGKLLTSEELEEYVREAERGYAIHTMTTDEYLAWLQTLADETTREQLQTEPRTCCETPPNTSHTGECKNSIMRSGEPNFNVNE
jgi:hypothetical protein